VFNTKGNIMKNNVLIVLLLSLLLRSSVYATENPQETKIDSLVNKHASNKNRDTYFYKERKQEA